MFNSALSHFSNGGRSTIAILSFLWFSLLISSSFQIGLVKAIIHDPLSNNIFLPSEIENNERDHNLQLRTCTRVNPLLYYKPVIGILSHPGDGASGRLSNATTASYIPASYVKFVESAGARVIPLIYNDPTDVLEEKLGLVNGVIFTGGRVRDGLYYSVAEKIFQKVLSRNEAGDHVPLYGISLGFQLISTMVGKNFDIIEPFNATRFPSALKFNDFANIRGTVFERVPLSLRIRATKDCITWEDHKYGISPETFEQNEGLSSFFQILTTSIDKNNKVYVSTANARNYPVTIFQWSPEKNSYEWGISTIPHTEYAIELTHKVAHHLVSEARRSINKPPVNQVLEKLIYKYSPIYNGKAGKGYDQVYLFE
ncbi:gamma-glutamyl hydrolase 2-like [Benincasa hispida]|uniref:gamma-glutamyl hydrolase 2-like n=1 Tax=Benincasa hispida TaxID=102211 RepID=UPI001900D0D3|nr:gamma-glutamyl hydrolase 2-like [Benincasa hispida]